MDCMYDQLFSSSPKRDSNLGQMLIATEHRQAVKLKMYSGDSREC